jgi:hypothetical protein
MDILHAYHTNSQLFPTPAERALAMAPGENRILLLNWKPATDMTWAAVAAGQADARIDRLANYIDATFPYRFFLAIWHEPENDVVPAAGSGMTAADYAAMYRHVVLRLRADGVTNAVTVMDYMGYSKWAKQSWFSQLWPGDDVVDWIGLDPYDSVNAKGYTASSLAGLVDSPSGSFPGYYTWAEQTHPGKPIMLAEWGVQYVASDPNGQAYFFDLMASQLSQFPNIKALVYFDEPVAQSSPFVTDPAQSALTRAAYQRLARATSVVGPSFTYTTS